MAVSLSNFGNSFVNMSGSDTAVQGSISSTHRASDFVLTTPALLTSFSIWLVDGVANNDGVFNTFSGTLSWRLFFDLGGVPSSVPMASFTVTPTVTDIGVLDASGREVFRVDVTVPITLNLPGGIFWLGFHENAWGSPSDGSDVSLLMFPGFFNAPSRQADDGGSWGTASGLPGIGDIAMTINGTSTVTFAENTVNGAPQLLDSDVSVATTAPHFGGGSLTLSGLLAEDRVSIREQGSITLAGSAVFYNGTQIGTFSGGSGATLTVSFNSNASAAAVEALIERLQYANTSNAPTATRTFQLGLSDGLGAATAYSSSLVLAVTPQDDAAVATADSNSGNEDLAITGNVLANDDPDGGPAAVTVSAVNGVSAAVGTEITLPSGAKLTLNADGSYSYDANGAFNLVTPATGSHNTATDSFTYTLSSGGTAMVTITINGVDQLDDWKYGGTGVDTLAGTIADDIFILNQSNDPSNNDTVDGGGGDDRFFMEDSFEAGDALDGGEGSDTLMLQGPYNMTLAGGMLNRIETIELMSGGDDRFGTGSAATLSYQFIMDDSAIGPGERLTIDGSGLIDPEALTFQGQNETDGSFAVYGGSGDDVLWGGWQADFFAPGAGSDILDAGGGIDSIYMGANLDPDDQINGGASNDILGLQGIYSNYSFSSGNMTSIEILALLSGSFTQYSGGTGAERYDYELIMADENVAAGQTLVVHASQLLAGEDLIFYGGQETNGSFFIYSGAGNDQLYGGAGNDIFIPSTGYDIMRGGGGNDIFYYRFAEESPVGANDTIYDFSAGDRINVFGLGEPGGLGIRFIGDDDFSNRAGELRVTGSGSDWLVEVDVDGDGTADFAIDVETHDWDYVWSAGDFAF